MLLTSDDSFSVFVPRNSRLRLTFDLAPQSNAVANINVQIREFLYELRRSLLCRIICNGKDECSCEAIMRAL